MPFYRRVEDLARTLDTSIEELRQFEQFGWISTVAKDGVSYLTDHQHYRAKFILELQRRRKLRPEQIDKVLAAQKPPYDLNDVDQVLSEG